MNRCRMCDHITKDHSTSFDGGFVNVQCDQDYCNCERFIRIDDMMEHS